MFVIFVNWGFFIYIYFLYYTCRSLTISFTKPGPERSLGFIQRRCFGLPESSPNASAAPARFFIDLGSHFGPFFMPLGVGTRFVELEPATPSNHGSWFVCFSKGAAVTLRVYNDFIIIHIYIYILSYIYIYTCMIYPNK